MARPPLNRIFPILALFLLAASVGLYRSFSGAKRAGGFISPVIFGQDVSAPDRKPRETSFWSNLNLSAKLDALGKVLGQSISREKTSSAPSPAGSGGTSPTAASTFAESFAGFDSSATPTPSSGSIPTSTPTPTPLSGASPTPTPVSGVILSPTSGPTTVPLSPEQNAVLVQAQLTNGYLLSKDYKSLYGEMSDDFKATFTGDDFVSSYSSAASVTTAALSGSPYVYGGNSEWAEQLTGLNLSDGSAKNYLLIFHKENGLWRLYGTEEKP